MHINDFIKLDLKIGDYIWIMNEMGEGFPGNYSGYLTRQNKLFNSKIIQTDKLRLSK